MKRYIKETIIQECIECPFIRSFDNAKGQHVFICRFLKEPIISSGNGNEEMKALRVWFEDMCILDKK